MSYAKIQGNIEKQLGPALRFKEFEGKWGKKKMGELSEKIGDGLHGTPKYVDESDIHFVNGNNLTNGSIHINDKTKKVDENTFLKNNKNLAQNTLLISLNGTIGNIARYNKEKVMLGKSIGYFNFSSASDYYYHVLNSPKIQRFYISELTGSTIKNLSLRTLRETIIPIPTLPEQQKIASFLSAVDEKIQELTKKKTLLEQYKKGIMQQLFSGQLHFKDENGNPYPDWEEKRLNEITSPIKRTSDRVIENIMTISGANGFMHQKDRFSQVIAANSLSKYTHLLKDEFAYNRGNSKSYKYGCIYKMRDPEALIPYVYHSFKLNEGVPEFMEQLFRAKYLDRQLRRLISSSARMDGLLNIGGKAFFETKVFFPVIEEQQNIATYLSSIDIKIKAVHHQITQTQTFKKGLLQQMFV